MASETEPGNVLRQLFNIYWLHKMIKVFNYRRRAVGIGNGQIGNGHSVIYVRNYVAYTSLTLTLSYSLTVIRLVLEQSLPCCCLDNPFGASQPIAEDIVFDPLGS